MKRLKKVVASMLALSCMSVNLVACDEDGSYTVTLMDGTSVIDTLEKDKETHLDVPSALTKDGYDFEGWYVDEALTIPYQPNVLSANLTLYAKYTAKTYYITFNLKGGTSTVNNVAVKKGEEYSIPAPTREGYTFSGWTLDGDEFSASGTYDKDGSVRLVANWDINKYTVTFKNNGNVVATQELAHGSKATAVETWVNFNAGYEIVGTYTDEAMTQTYDFNTEVKEGFTLYVKTQPRTFNLIVNQDGDVSLDRTVVYGDDYELPVEPTREGYIFKGYTYNDEEFATSGTYTYTSDIVVLANWEKDPTYGKSTISFYDGKTEIDNLSKIVDDGSTLTKADLVDAPVKAGYTFKGWYVDEALETAFEEAEITDDVDLYAKYEANTYLMTINLDGGEYQGDDADFELTQNVTFKDNYTLPIPVKNGYKFAGYTFNGKAENITGTYSWAENVAVMATWTKLDADADEESDALFMEKGTYFKERESVDDSFTYVFVTGKEYNLSVVGLDFGTASNAVSLDGTKFTTNSATDGAFTLTITKDFEGTQYTYTRQAKIVDQVMGFDKGADYQSAWGVGENQTLVRTTTFLDAKEDAVMTVGRTNYKPDLSIKKNAEETLTYEEANVVLTVTDDGNETDDYVINGNSITFGESIDVGSKIDITFAPKYSLTKQSVTMTMVLNEGVNVYDNATLKSAYADHAVNEINVLRNIKAELRETDYVKGKNVPINEYEYGVYTRKVSSTTDKITVNGNFFKVDGSNLPYMRNDIGGREWSVEGDAGYWVVNMQLGIFTYSNQANDKYMHNGQAVFNDLFITGNYTGDMAEVGDKIGNSTAPLLKYSGSYHGIVLRGGTVTTENVSIVNTRNALFSDGLISGSDSKKMEQASQWIVNSTKLDHSWANQIYMYDFVKTTITNSYLGDCSGAAIHIDDLAYEKLTYKEDGSIESGETDTYSAVYIDKATRIENYVAGTEAWFQAYGKAPVASTLKTSVEGGLMQLTAGYKQMNSATPDTTIIQTFDDKVDENGAKIQFMNFVLVIRSVNSEVADWQKDKQGIPYVDNNFTMYADLGTHKINFENMPNDEYQVYLPFSTALLTGGVVGNATDYMYGIVEVMKA